MESTRVSTLAQLEAGIESARANVQQLDSTLADVDDDGNVDFAVWGYMNRGEREGEVGIRICHYDAKINTIKETAFLPWDKPYSNLSAQLKKLLYLSDDGTLYLCLENGAYRLNLEEKTMRIRLNRSAGNQRIIKIGLPNYEQFQNS